MLGARTACCRLSGLVLAVTISLVAPAAAAAGSHVTIAVVPAGTTVEQISRLPSMSPGLLSAGLGSVSAAQTYLDITQGSRLFNRLYHDDLPAVVDTRGDGIVGGWRQVRERADSAPADLVPGLLASTVPVVSESSGEPAIVAANERGIVRLAGPGCRKGCGSPVRVAALRNLGQLARLAAQLRGDDLLIAFERPPPATGGLLAMGIAGKGFDGDLTSGSTRTNGLVLTTDIAPTILGRLGIPVPDAMNGREITTEGEADAPGVAALGDRLVVIGERRGPVVGLTVLAWFLIAGVGALIGRRYAKPIVRVLALAIVYLPLLLLVGAALRPSAGDERLLIGLGAPALGALTAVILPGWRAMAVACGAVVAAYAADAIGGSALISQSLFGPNPALGVRFYGIGNELEAILGPLAIGGTGAALAASGPRSARAAAIIFVASGLFFGLLFGSGRFGADVGAVIVLATGGVVAGIASGWWRPSTRVAVIVVILVGVAAVAVLGAVDLLTGGDSHFTRSVIDAGGTGNLVDVFKRRLTQTVRSFGRVALPFLLASLAICALAVWRRDRVLALFDDPWARAGFIGAAAAVVIGVAANDSGAVLLEIGTVYLAAICGFAWAQASGRTGSGD